jgi:hypothetical protein
MPEESTTQLDDLELDQQEIRDALEQLETEIQPLNDDYTTALQNDTGLAGSLFWLVLLAALAVLMIVSMWKIFQKADKPGWASIVPVYNSYVMLKIAGLPGWWLLLFFIPFLNIVFGIIALVYFLQSYGKGVGFIVATVFFPYITYPMLAFGKDKYQGPAYGKQAGQKSDDPDLPGNVGEQ